MCVAGETVETTPNLSFWSVKLECEGELGASVWWGCTKVVAVSVVAGSGMEYWLDAKN